MLLWRYLELIEFGHKAQAPVVRRLDNTIYWVNHYPVNKAVCFTNTYLLAAVVLYQEVIRDEKLI